MYIRKWKFTDASHTSLFEIASPVAYIKLSMSAILADSIFMQEMMVEYALSISLLFYGRSFKCVIIKNYK